MTIQLHKDLEADILAAVQSGRFASLDDAMSEAASLLLERLEREQSEAEAPTTSPPEAVPSRKPI